MKVPTPGEVILAHNRLRSAAREALEAQATLVGVSTEDLDVALREIARLKARVIALETEAEEA